MSKLSSAGYLDNTKNLKTSQPHKMASLQLAFLGIVSILIGIVCMLDVVIMYDLPIITSISESATTGVKAGMILPFGLGCMFTFSISYNGYDKLDRILTRTMGVGFLVVAMQICNSEVYLTESDRVGLLALPPVISGVVHSVGAIVGFGAMWYWISFQFCKSNRKLSIDNKDDRRKIERNRVYRVCGSIMFIGIIIFIVGAITQILDWYVFLAEEFLLIPAGVALMVKSGLILKDKLV